MVTSLPIMLILHVRLINLRRAKGCPIHHLSAKSATFSPHPAVPQAGAQDSFLPYFDLTPPLCGGKRCPTQLLTAKGCPTQLPTYFDLTPLFRGAKRCPTQHLAAKDVQHNFPPQAVLTQLLRGTKGCLTQALTAKVARRMKKVPDKSSYCQRVSSIASNFSLRKGSQHNFPSQSILPHCSVHQKGV